ncbi:hypothetical protein [Pseudomonas sp. K2I15]|uniref:hypothetical protein n=1 Tax=unclassified Pseudomonas TaxID=196821 RepID=UPI00113100CE|nr:hypothetical protein [Pseudomonas sp. K2I15]
MNVAGVSGAAFLISLSANTFLSCAEFSVFASDEVMIASCHLKEKGNKSASFCASSDKEIVNVRLGLGSSVDFNSVFSRAAPLSRWVDAATYTVYLGFRRGEYCYAFGVPQETLGAKAFL